MNTSTTRITECWQCWFQYLLNQRNKGTLIFVEILPWVWKVIWVWLEHWCSHFHLMFLLLVLCFFSSFFFVVFRSFCCPIFGCFLALDKLQLQESLTNFSSMLWFVAFELFICVVDWLGQRSCFSFPFHYGWFYLLWLIVHHYKLECWVIF